MGKDKMGNLVSDFTRFYILMILYEGPTHGYDIMKAFEERVGRKISPGIVYPFLQLLEESGYIIPDIEMIGEKERKIYHLTKKGGAFTNQLFKRFAGILSTSFESRINVCVHCGCKIYEGAYTEVIDGEEMSFCCVHCANHYKKSVN
jgi:DNA-binding PadR family transcriptional regulator